MAPDAVNEARVAARGLTPRRWTAPGFLFALVMFMPSSVLADAGLGAAIDDLFGDLDTSGGPGCAVGVIHDGNYIHQAGYGLANLEHGIPISTNTVFRVGSVSKQFTAMAIAILAGRGDLDLDADVHKYLPDLVDYGHEVTVRQIVHHIAGMGDYDHDALRNADGTEFRFGNEDYSTIEEFYSRVARADLVHAPGTRFLYSNLGYFLLAHVVERVSGMSLREFADAEIFRPLGMASSFFNDNVNQPVRNRADGYRLMSDGSFEIFMTNLDYVGDGGVYTSLDDFIRWDRNFYANELGRGGRSLIDLVQTPHPDTIAYTEEGPVNENYAFGMRVTEANGEAVISHGGSWVGFTAMYERYPELNLSVVTFCNSTAVRAQPVGAEVSKLAVAAIRGR